ncbi:MAG: M20 family metallopeptidase [Fuerstiella sp.]|nr:M20 family metallopeptidase [Fuerstiella sp.]
MSAVNLLKQLIEFPSVSTSTNDPVSSFAESQLKGLGFQTERLTYTDPGGVLKTCICGRRGPMGKGLAYFCHTDVVPADTWSFPESGPWSPFQSNDRIYGRGSCDMKGSLACMLSAVERIESTSSPVFVICTADEEIGYHGAAKVAAESTIYREIVNSQSYGLIGEPTRLRVVHGHKGGRVGKIVSRGIAAHSSTSRGLNANMAMIPFLNELRTLSLECDSDPEWRDERFDPPVISMNIGINDHTHAVNITPPQSVCTFYFRPMPGQDGDRLIDRIRSIVDRHGLEFELRMSANGLFTSPDSMFIRELCELTSSKSSTVTYGTDGSLFGEIQNLAVLGPGDIDQAHTDDEWISLDQLSRGVDLYEKLIRHWCV